MNKLVKYFKIDIIILLVHVKFHNLSLIESTKVPKVHSLVLTILGTSVHKIVD